jgi:hypothetical protein
VTALPSSIAPEGQSKQLGQCNSPKYMLDNFNKLKKKKQEQE